MIFTQSEFEAYAQAVDEAEYISGHDYAVDLIERYTHATLETDTVTGESHDFDSYVPLRVLPATSITRVLDEDGDVVDPDCYYLSDGKLGIIFTFDTPKRSRSFDTWQAQPGRVTVDYVGGYVTVPEVLKRAALEITKQRLVPVDAPSQSVTSLSSGGVTFDFNLANWSGKPTGTDWVDAALNAYRITVI